jgi:hypothetical protein
MTRRKALSVYCATSRLVVLVTDRADTTHGFLRNRASYVCFYRLGTSGGNRESYVFF